MSANSAASSAKISAALGSMGQGSVVSEVAERLMAYFTSGDIAPGTRLPAERQLAASLGVGRSAVREALAALEILGIVIVRPGSGTYLRDGVSELLPRTLSWGLMLGEPRTRELVELRSGLEVQAVQLAAMRITEAALARMRANLDSMEKNLGNLAAFVEADAAFHKEIAASSGNQVLQELLQSIRSLLRIWVDRALTDEGHAAAALAEHRAIFTALESHDATAVTDAMASHMDTASRRLLAGYDAAR
ncbi:GntR family transcriptional repressor for pyruvate dehydrogenase complex [Arthrobacter sp. PvP102]|uniref:FadR/GntR family transcriptional regulator n=1 Tax=unclassified Arthrobacter TaxID=235627 RepID=UPI001AE82E2D|nr:MULTISPECIES: FadR/GntR family transcriptional regulator [unclassified Arthrobacter]MBP1233925.1 GntR family transcriptional repressor for pyruvate dehydrogenase complex [Arthrobacter sp. PvP103]MBP1239059.1 GntR family transcriptional repressor for pyruvate dehydrogenase complex [Arthrobacter sp. PvP102]